MKDSAVETIAILLIFLVERIITHRYLVQQNRLQKLNNFLSQHYNVVDRFFEDLESEIEGSLQILSEPLNKGISYDDVLAQRLSRIKSLNNKFHSAIIIPISTIEKTKYSILTDFSNGFIDTVSTTLQSSDQINSLIEDKGFDEKINFYKTRVFRTLHS